MRSNKEIVPWKKSLKRIISEIEGYKWEHSDWENLAEMARRTFI